MTTRFTRSFLLFTFLVLFGLTALGQKPGSYADIKLDGLNDYALIPDDTSLNPKNEITVEAWIRSDTFGKNIYDHSVFCKHGWSAGNAGYVLRVGAGGGVSFIVSGRAAGNAWQEANTTTAVIEKGKWYHIAGTFDGDSVNVYLNGDLVATKLYSGQINISTNLDAKIGQMAYGGGRIFEGEIDEVRVWNKAMSDSMLRAYMCQKITKAHPNYGNLVGYWNMDENTGTTIADRSPYGNDGSLRNGTMFAVSPVPLGDTSIVSTGTATVNLGSDQGDVLTVKSTFSTPGWTHVYMTNDTTTNPADPAFNVKLDTSHYYGLYTTDPKASFTVSLDYGNHTVNGTTDECGVDLLVKETGGGGEWGGKNAAYFANGDSLVFSGFKSAELMLGIYQMDSANALTTETGNPWFCSNYGVRLLASGNRSFRYKWYRNDTALVSDTLSDLWVTKTGTYKVDIERSSACKITSNGLAISMKQAPSATLKPFKGVCVDTDTVKLSGGSPAGGHFIFSGLYNDSLVLPGRVGAGDHDIVYEINDTNGCWARDTQVLTIWSLPKVYFQGGIRLCNNLDTVKLTAGTPSGGNYTGPGIVNNNFIPEKISRVAGRYPVTYGYTDGNGCYNETMDSITVLQYNKASIFPLPMQCEKYDPVVVTYYPPGGQLSGTGISGNTFYPGTAGPGTHNLTYRYTNAEGCTDINVLPVTVYPNSPVTWNYSITSCLNGDTIDIDEGSPAGGYFTGSGVVDSFYFLSIAAGKGNHDIQYVYVDTNGCKNIALAKATVNDTAALNVTDLGSICQNKKITLNNVTPGGGKYSGPGVSGGELLPWTTDTGDVRIFYSYFSGTCTSYAHINGYIIPVKPALLDYPDALCDNMDPIRLNASPSGGTFSGNGVISGLFAPQFAGAGKHYIVYTYTDGFGCVSLTGDTITVVAVPQASAISYYGLCRDETKFNPDFGDPAPNYRSYYRLNADTIKVIDPDILGTGKFKVYYVLYSDAGCKDSALTDLTINPQPSKPVISRTGNVLRSSALNGNQWYSTAGIVAGEVSRDFEPAVDGDYYVVVTSDSGCFNTSDTIQFIIAGVQSASNTRISVSPNPTTSMIEIHGAENIELIQLFDLHGRLIQTFNGVVENRIDLGNIASGRYSVVCYSEGKRYIAVVNVQR